MELLSPAGNITKLKYALGYGADAVYASGKLFGLRAKSTNFSESELREAVKICHSQPAVARTIFVFNCSLLLKVIVITKRPVLIIKKIIFYAFIR